MSKHYAILHAIPGRTRLHLPGCTLEPTLVEAKIRALPGIDSAFYSPITKSLVIYHNFKRLPASHLRYVARQFPISENSESDDLHETMKREIKELALVGGTALLDNLFLNSQGLVTPTALAVLYASRHIIKNGVATIFHPTADTLTTTSLIALLLNKKPSSAVILYAMSTAGELLSQYTADKTRGFVKEMMALDVTKAWLIGESGQYVEVEVSQVQKGDSIMVFHGEKVPLDGTVSN